MRKEKKNTHADKQHNNILRWMNMEHAETESIIFLVHRNMQFSIDLSDEY